MGILMMTESKDNFSSIITKLQKGTRMSLYERNTESALNMHMTEQADSRHPGPHAP